MQVHATEHCRQRNERLSPAVTGRTEDRKPLNERAVPIHSIVAEVNFHIMLKRRTLVRQLYITASLELIDNLRGV